MALYSIGASWDPGMSRYNRGVKRSLAGIDGLSFAYRLNTWGPKQGPPMIPANLASPLSWVEGVFGIQSASSILSDANDQVTADMAKLSSTLTTIQALLTQIQAYDNSSQSIIATRSQALQAQATGLAGNANDWSTLGQTVLGAILAAQADPALSKDQATLIKGQADNIHDQVSALADGVKKLGKDTASLLKDAGASPGMIQAIEDKLVGSVSTITWIAGGSLAIYLLLPTFLPRLVGGIRKSVHS